MLRVGKSPAIPCALFSFPALKVASAALNNGSFLRASSYTSAKFSELIGLATSKKKRKKRE